MTTFDERERAFENKFAHDAEMQFRAASRRDRLLGLWAAEMLGKKGPEAEAYAQEVIAIQVRKAGGDAAHARILADLTAAGAPVDSESLRRRMAALLVEAKAQILAETPD